MSKPDISELLASFCDALQDLFPEWWNKEKIEELFFEYCRAADIEPSKLIRPLTGSLIGFSLFEAMSILGKEKTIETIKGSILCTTIPDSTLLNC